MATIAVSASINFDAITGKGVSVGDIYALSNGAVMTIDSDPSYTLNPTSSINQVTFNASTGGELKFDGTGVRLIPYNSGSGNVPAYGASISEGGVSATLIGVWASFGVAPTAAGAAMPASGYIKVKGKTGGNFSAGALTGIGASATGADVVGWISCNFGNSTNNTGTFGKITCVGDWLELGTTSGVRNQTVQLPFTSGLAIYAGVWIETGAGTNVYEHFLNAVATVNAATGTGERAKVCWITSANGVCRIGHDGTNAVGFLPGAGRKIRIPNVIINKQFNAAGINASYNGAVANVHQFLGNLNVSNMATSGSLTAGGTSGSVTSVASSAACSGLNIAIGKTVTLSDIITGAGQGVSNAYIPFSIVGTLHERVVISADKVSTFTPTAAQTAVTCNYVSGLITNLRVTKGGASVTGLMTSTVGCDNLTFDGVTLVGGGIGSLGTSWNSYVQYKNIRYAAALAGGNAAGSQNFAVWLLGASTGFQSLDGFRLIDDEPELHPYGGLVQISGNLKFSIKYLVSQVSPVNCGTVNACAYAISGAGSSQIDGVASNIYTTNLRTGLINSTNLHGRDITFQNCYGDYADTQRMNAGKGNRFRSTACAVNKTASTWGDSFCGDQFTSGTTGTLIFAFSHAVHKTPYTASANVLFDKAGGVQLITIGDSLVVEMDYTMRGHTAFQNVAPTMTGGTIGNYNLEFQYDLNDQAGYNGVWLSMTGANLAAVPIINASKGVRLKVRITTTTTNASTITFLSVDTVTDTTSMHAQHPMSSNVLTFTGLPLGTDIVVLSAGTTTILKQVDACAASFYAYTYDDTPLVDVGFIKAGYQPQYIRNLQLTAQDSTLPIALIADRNYL